MTGQLTGVGPDRPTQRPRGDHKLAALAARQHGVVSRKQLLALGLKRDAIEYRLKVKRLHALHRGVYAVGHPRLTLKGSWLAAVLACGEEALLSHRTAAALWGLMRSPATPVHVSSKRGRGRQGIFVHGGQIPREDRTIRDAIPVTSVERTLLDLAEVVDEQRLERAFEEADRLGLLELAALERICERALGRRGIRPVRKLVAAAREPEMVRSPLEGRFVEFCRKHQLPPPALNSTVLGFEVDALWPAQRLIVELDGFAFHQHRAAFERDRARDASLQAAGYRVIRLTHRRLQEDGRRVAHELRRLLA